MVQVAYHPAFTHPLPPGHRFPMLKYELLYEQLLHEGVIDPSGFFEPGPAQVQDIVRVHDPDYWHRLRALKLSPKEIRRIGFPLTQALVDREMRIAQGSILAAAYAAENGLGFNIAGGTHHAGRNWGEGFCLLNDQAIAAGYLLNHKLAKKILIIDLDVHQGNGTADIFSAEPRVFTFSMHGENNFPFKKERSDLDTGLADGITDPAYMHALEKIIPGLLEQVRPDFVFYQSGVDVLETDRFGKFCLSLQGCKERDMYIFRQLACRGLPVQTSMGGGYSPGLREIVDAHCHTFKAAMLAYA